MCITVHFVLVNMFRNSMLLINNHSKRGDVETLARSVNLEDDMCLLVPFSNGRREGANLSSRVIVLPSLESQTFVMGQLYCFK